VRRENVVFQSRFFEAAWNDLFAESFVVIRQVPQNPYDPIARRSVIE
jgi:hypothetical protein